MVGGLVALGFLGLFAVVGLPVSLGVGTFATAIPWGGIVTGIVLACTGLVVLSGRRLPVPAETAAHGLHALLDGTTQNWLLDPGAFDLESSALKAVDIYLRGLGLD